MRNEILRSIDNIANEESESLLNVSNAILNYYEKQQIVLENCDDIYAYEFPEDGFIQEAVEEGTEPVDASLGKKKQEPSIIAKIWNAIKQFFRMIADSISRLIDKITGRGSSSESGNKIISCDSIVLKLLTNSAANKPDNTREWPIPRVNPKYTVDEEDSDEEGAPAEEIGDEVVEEAAMGNYNKYIVVNIPTGNGSTFYPKQVKVPNNDIIAAVNNTEKTITFHQAGFGKWDSTSGETNAHESTPALEGTKKPWSHSSKTALGLIQNPKAMDKLSDLVDYAIDVLFKNEKRHHIKFNTTCKAVIDDISHTVKHAKCKEVKVSLKELTDFQKKINSMVVKIDKFSNINVNVSKFDKKTISSFNELYKKLLDVQISMNMVSSSFNTSLIINAHYIGAIKSLALLDEFVNMMIEEGIPPKYIAYNTWLVADECIRGSKTQYKPIWGQTRFIFFPPNKQLCYKIAMSGAGITSNKAEIRTSEMFKKMDRIDLIAPVVKHWHNDAIVVMERINNDATPSYATCISYTNRCNAAIEEYEKAHKVNLNIRIADQHKDNVKYDKQNKCYRSIDYGIATRAYVKNDKK